MKKLIQKLLAKIGYVPVDPLQDYKDLLFAMSLESDRTGVEISAVYKGILFKVTVLTEE